MKEGRDARRQFAAGPSSDRGNGPPPAPAASLLTADMHRIVMDSANLPVSISRGRGRRIVTLYEAQIRRLATGRVLRRAALMDYLRLVQQAVAAAGTCPDPTPDAAAGAVHRLQAHLDQLRERAEVDDASQIERSAVTFYELLLGTVGHRRRR